MTDAAALQTSRPWVKIAGCISSRGVGVCANHAQPCEEVGIVRRALTLLLTCLALGLGSLAALGAAPQQERPPRPPGEERPPQPFFQDFYSGQASVQGQPAPEGALLVACVSGCVSGFQTPAVAIAEGGQYSALEVNPGDESFIGGEITFFLVNELGFVQAEETRVFVGIFDFYTQDLTFSGLPAAPPEPTPTPTPTATPMPPPTPTAALPAPGDPGVTAIPRLALIVGVAAVAGGAGLLLLARRRVGRGG